MATKVKTGYKVGSAGKKARHYATKAAAKRAADRLRGRKLKGVYVMSNRSKKFC